MLNKKNLVAFNLSDICDAMSNCSEEETDEVYRYYISQYEYGTAVKFEWPHKNSGTYPYWQWNLSVYITEWNPEIEEDDEIWIVIDC